MSISNIRVEKNNSEPSTSLLRRFQKKMQESGVLPKVRGKRYNERALSLLKVKKAKLKRIKNAIEYQTKKRMGMIVAKPGKK